ncbi:hypothetical protein AVEN_246437-1, partial [Araneus ventricosus]
YAKERGKDDEGFVDTHEGKIQARLEREVKDVQPPLTSSPCEGTFEAVVMENRQKRGKNGGRDKEC